MTDIIVYFILLGILGWALICFYKEIIELSDMDDDDDD